MRKKKSDKLLSTTLPYRGIAVGNTFLNDFVGYCKISRNYFRRKLLLLVSYYFLVCFFWVSSVASLVKDRRTAVFSPGVLPLFF